MDLVQEQFQLFLPTRTMAFRDKISKRLVDLGKVSSRHKAMDLWGVTHISTILRLVSHWINSSNKTFRMQRRWLVLKVSRSNLNNSYGKTATNLAASLFYWGLVTSVKVAFRAISVEITIVHDPRRDLTGYCPVL